MKLNFDIICDSLQDSYPILRYGTAGTDLHLIAPRFYTGECLSDYIYLLDTKELPEHFEAPAIWIGQDCAALEKIAYPLAVICSDVSAAELMNTLLKIFDQFRAWDESLRECVDMHLSLRELAGRGAAQIGCRILISDKKLVLLADSRFYHASPDVSLNYQGEALPIDTVRIFQENAARQQKLRVPYLDGRYEGHYVYNINIYFGDRYEGVCSLMEEDRAFRPSDFTLFLHFFQYAYREFQFYNGTPGKQSEAFRSVIKMLLEQRQTNEKMEALVKPYENIYNEFYCLVLTAAKGRIPPDEYLCFTIECLFSESISLVYDNKVVALIPWLNGPDLDALHSVIDPLQLYIGLSDCGSRIREVPILYRQAFTALDAGIREKPEQRIHTFARHKLDYLLGHSVGEFPVEAFKTEGFRRLEALDAESTVDYMHTLRVYLDQEMNSSESAKWLFVHRSSFLKRLEHIREILGSELETPESRLLLRWLLYLTQEK